MSKSKIYYIDINNEDATGMDAISLVDAPAVGYNFLCFNDQEKNKVEIKFKKDEVRHIISGVVCLADVPIYRYNDEIGEYYVIFTKEIIERLVTKYSKDGLFNSLNFQHIDEDKVNNVYLIESYFIDKERGICPEEFKDVNDGSWICSFKVEDEDLWNEIINGNELNGFSLQGLFELKRYKLVPSLDKEHSDKHNNFNEDDIEKIIDNILE